VGNSVWVIITSRRSPEEKESGIDFMGIQRRRGKKGDEGGDVEKQS